MAKGHFDAEAFYDALDAERQARNLTWKEVAAQSGMSASTLTRMAQGRRPDVDSLAALLTWSGLSANDFIRDESDVAEGPAGGGAERERGPEPLAMISTYLRGDKHLTPESAKALDELVKAVYERLRKD